MASTPSPEVVAKLANRLVELKREMAAAQAEWKALFSQNGVSIAASSERKGTVQQSGSVGRILIFLNSEPDLDFDPKAISKKLDIPLATTRTSLSKLVSKKLIQKRGAGLYGALIAELTSFRPQEKEATEMTS